MRRDPPTAVGADLRTRCERVRQEATQVKESIKVTCEVGAKDEAEHDASLVIPTSYLYVTFISSCDLYLYFDLGSYLIV